VHHFSNHARIAPDLRVILLDIIVANGHIEETVRNIRGNAGYAQPPHLFVNQGKNRFRDAASQAGTALAQPKVARGLAYGDFDRDGDSDLLMTTNNGSAILYRNDQLSGNRSIRFRLTGTKSNRDAIGARVRIFHGGISQSRTVKCGFQLSVAIGVARNVRNWPP
jgi:enediyne biosynthesis protein E4